MFRPKNQSRDQGRKSSKITGTPKRRNKDNKEDLDYGGSQYDNSQYGSAHYDNSQYDNDQYDQYDDEGLHEVSKRAIDEEQAGRPMGQFSGEENSGEDESDEQNGDTYLKAAKTYEDTERRGWTALKAGEDQWPQPGFAR